MVYTLCLLWQKLGAWKGSLSAKSSTVVGPSAKLVGKKKICFLLASLYTIGDRRRVSKAGLPSVFDL